MGRVGWGGLVGFAGLQSFSILHTLASGPRPAPSTWIVRLGEGVLRWWGTVRCEGRFVGFSSFHCSLSVGVPMVRLLGFFGLSFPCSGVVHFVYVVGFSLCFIWLVVGFSLVFLFLFRELDRHSGGLAPLVGTA